MFLTYAICGAGGSDAIKYCASLAIGGFTNMATALYYSLSSYTTVGYADVVLPEQMRLLGPLEAATGMLMFGWSTGYIFAFATRMLANQNP